MEDSVTTFETHLTAVMDSLIRASVCEITKLFQDTVNDYLVEISLNRKENDALKLRLRLTENKLRNERKYGMGWAADRRNSGLAVTEDGGRKKRKMEVPRGQQKLGPAAAYGKGWPGGVWEEGGGAAAGMVAGGGGRKEAREMYLIQFPGEEEEEEEGEEMEEGEGSLAGEGEETGNIKEETGEVEGRYQTASLRLIKEALRMDPPDHTGSRSHSEAGEVESPAGPDGAKRSLAARSGEGNEEEEGWEVGSSPTEDSQGGMSVEELSGLETALRAERGREIAALRGPSHPVTPDPEIVPGSEYSLAQKYIGLDGLEQDGGLERPEAPDGEVVGPEGALRPGWVRRLRDGEEAGLEVGVEAGVGVQAASVELAGHEEAHHLEGPGSVDDSGEEETGDLLHFCPHCGGGFSSEAELEEHPCPLGGAHLAGAGSEDTPFPCASCGNTFSHAWALKNHECACAAERPHHCELCGKRFTHTRSLERHQAVHTGERPHRCPQCGRSFSRLGNLERHLRIHTGERPYGCEACGKRFSRVEYLKRHQLIHSSERTAGHQCAQCGKSFSEPEQLKSHQCFISI
ncbi:zinc finger and SCAN domain-containing protein 22 isoform X1 [Osmerus eperlanus]|uniref:zinc finger and SCAN domain-containing protein 22 isoform X1 n=2 Tax=Osmerus eperlanus TaxID=29151 RepID=UPI002E1539B9